MLLSSLRHTDILEQIMHLAVTIGPEIYNPLFINVIRNPFTQNIGPRFADIQDEIKTAFADYIPTGQGNGE
jgi:hypothetical protein